MNLEYYAESTVREFCDRLKMPAPQDCTELELEQHVESVRQAYFMDEQLFRSCMGDIHACDSGSAFEDIIHKQREVIVKIQDALVPAHINYDTQTGKRLTIDESAQRIVSELLTLRKHNEQLHRRLTDLARYGDK